MKNSSENTIFNVESPPPSNFQILVCFLKLAIPSAMANVLGFLILTTTSFFAGRLGDSEKLAAIGLGNVCCIIFFITFFIGLNGATDTLTS